MVQVTSVRVYMYRPAVDQFRGWTGPIGRSIMRLARETRFRQRAMVGTKSGHLRASITVGERTHWAMGIQTTIGAGAGQGVAAGRGRGGRFIQGYSVYNDQGTLPHRITPRRPGGMLVFFWAKVGHVVHLRAVNHPGNRAYHWAERGLRAAMAQWQRGG